MEREAGSFPYKFADKSCICHLRLRTSNSRAFYPSLRSRGGIGRRVRLRTVWGNPWRFESSREQISLIGSLRLRSLFSEAEIMGSVSWERRNVFVAMKKAGG